MRRHHLAPRYYY